MRRDAVAIVPAGGAARRLGPSGAVGKAALPIGGRTCLEHVCAALAVEVPRVIVVAAPGTPVPRTPERVEVVRDSAPLAGPLAAVRDGLVHALAAAERPRLAVLCACDMPLVTPAVIRLVLERAGGAGARWAVPIVDGHPQPLLSALGVDLLPLIEAELVRGHGSLRDLAAALERDEPSGLVPIATEVVRGVDPALESFLDVDTPEDLALVAGRLAARPHGG